MKNNEKKNNKLNLKKKQNKTFLLSTRVLKNKIEQKEKLRPHAWIKFQEKTKQAILS